MAVFYKYVDRQVSDQINWADISKSLSQTFDAERDAREKKKAEIDQATLDYVEKLQSQPQTESKSLNDRLGQFTSDASSMSKTMLDDLKAGRINLRDYSIRTQNLKSDTNVALDLVQTYGKRYSEVMKGIKGGELSAAQESFMARFEGFANLANNRLYVDPTSGRVYAANEVLDPKTGIKKMGDNIQNVAAMKQMMEQDIPRINVNSELDARAKALGGFITEDIVKGKYYSTAQGIKFEDATKQEAYDKSLRNIANELVGGEGNPRAVSFFVDNMRISPATYDKNGKVIKEGAPYKLVYSEADRKSPSDILMKEGASGVYFPELTQEQINDAQKYIQVEMRQKIKSSTERDMINLPEPPQPRAKTDDEREAEGKEKEKKDKIRYIMQLAFPTSTTDRKTALDYINGLPRPKDAPAVTYDFTANGDLRATYNNNPNNTRIFSIKDGMTKTQWAAITSGIHGVTDVGMVLRENTFPTSKSASRPEKGTVESGVTMKTGATALRDRLNNTAMPSLESINKDGEKEEIDESKVVAFFNELLGDSGFEVSGTGYIRDKITIKGTKRNKDGKVSAPLKEFDVNDMYTTEGYNKLMKEITEWIDTNAKSLIDEQVVSESERTRNKQGTTTSPAPSTINTSNY
jgi:hypothetical protein